MYAQDMGKMADEPKGAALTAPKLLLFSSSERSTTG